MNLLGFISTAVVSLALVVAAPAFAQEQHEQEEQKSKPAAQEEKKAQPEKSAKPEQRPEAQQEKSAMPEEKNARQEEKNAKPAEKNAQREEKNANPAEKNARQDNKNAKPGEKNAQQEQHATNNGGGRIPADKFKANFGQQHSFRVSENDYRSHRFQYGGYAFGFVDPWPSNWLYTQYVYVIEIDGVYYLCNASFPGVNLALSFTL
jgi:DNA mismatch repair ATPase MutL